MLEEQDDVHVVIDELNSNSFSQLPPRLLKDFDCGDDFLNKQLKKSIKSQLDGNNAHLLMMFEEETGRCIGFLTWTINVLSRELAADLLASKVSSLPKTVPVFKVSMIAIDNSFKGSGLGSALLQSALADFAERCDALKVIKGVIVDALKGREGFYGKKGFSALTTDPDSPTTTMFLPIEQLLDACSDASAVSNGS